MANEQTTGANPGVPIQPAVDPKVANCLSLIEQFKDGDLTSAEVIQRIFTCLNEDTGAAQDYIKMVFDLEIERQRAQRRGAAATGDADGRPAAPVANGANGGSGSGGGSGGASGSRTFTSDPTQYAFYTDPDDDDDIDDTVLKAIMVLKRNYVADIKQAKQHFILAVDRPDFPQSLLEALLQNQYVDLDKVHSSLYATGPPKTTLGRIGDVELASVDGDIRPASKISNHGEWVISFGKYADACTYVYPCRKNELRKYAAHIGQQFAAIRPELHYRILQYDRAARMLAGNSNAIRLDHFQLFSALYIQYISSAGAGSREPGASGGKRQGRKKKVQDGASCIRWNKGADCDDESCKFFHYCSVCKGDHRKVACSQRTGGKGRRDGAGVGEASGSK